MFDFFYKKQEIVFNADIKLLKGDKQPNPYS
jgi:hypothetical protein